MISRCTRDIQSERGSVQVHRSLGSKDEKIVKKVRMKGHNAYANFCEEYNKCAYHDILRFTSVEEYVKHMRNIVGKEKS